MRIASVGTAFPPHRYPQAVITQALKEKMHGRPEIPGIMDRLHANCGVDYRHIMYPLDQLGMLRGFGCSNDLWIKGAMELGQEAIEKALEQVGLEPKDISAIFFTSVTGIACPSIDARLVNRMGFPKRIKRTPIFGLGCVAGAAGIARAADYVRAFPKQYALLLNGGAVLADVAGEGLFHGAHGGQRTVWRRRGGGGAGGRRDGAGAEAEERRRAMPPRGGYAVDVLSGHGTFDGMEDQADGLQHCAVGGRSATGAR